MRPVVDLLVEQIECADYIILNKIDQLDAAQLESLKGIASSLNPLSRVSRHHMYVIQLWWYGITHFKYGLAFEAYLQTHAPVCICLCLSYSSYTPRLAYSQQHLMGHFHSSFHNAQPVQPAIQMQHIHVLDMSLCYARASSA